MVVINVVNGLPAALTVGDVSVPGLGGTAAVPVTGNSFTVVATGTYACTYTVPLICNVANPPADNACAYTNPPNAVWSFQAPLPVEVPAGYLIGSTDAVGAYTLQAGACGLVVTADAAVTGNTTVTLTVTAATATNSTIPIGAQPVFLTSSANTITITAKSSANATTLASTVTTDSYADILTAWAANPVPVLLPMYYTKAAQGPYAAKQALLATLTMAGTTLTVHLSLPVGSPQLGFAFESFYYPPYFGQGGSRSTLGFYGGSLSTEEFLPEAPFVLSDIGGNYAQKTTTTFSIGGPEVYTIFGIVGGPIVASPLAFRRCPSGGNMFQLLWLTDSAPNSQWYILDGNLGLGSDLATACAEGQWGLFQIWDTTVNGYVMNVALAYRTAAGAITWLTSASGTLTMTSVSSAVINSPLGFVSFSDSSSYACSFQVTLAPASTYLTVQTHQGTAIKLITGAIPAAYYENCWATTPPLAYRGAGGPMCSSVTATATNAYLVGKRAFVVDTCLGEMADCNAVAGTVPEKCVGWLGRTTEAYCSVACSSQPQDGVNLATFCDQTKVAYCEASSAQANSAECSCIKADTSSYKVDTRWGMSYPQFVTWITETYGVTGNTSLNPQCWWDTCATNGGMKLSNTVLTCPKIENSCVNLVKDLKVDGTSLVKLSLVNDCNISSKNTTKSTPCSSLGTLMNNVQKGSSIGGGAPVSGDPNVFTTFDIVLLALVGGAAAIMVMCTIGAVVVKVHRVGAL